MAKHTSKELFSVVGIGVSGQHHTSLVDLLEQMDANTHCSLIVLPDPASDFEWLAQQLQHSSPFPVQRLQHTTPLCSQQLYLVPPDQVVRLVDHQLDVSAPETTTQRLNTLFHSLAENKGTLALGLLLSDHIQEELSGLQALHRAGGVALIHGAITAASQLAAGLQVVSSVQQVTERLNAVEKRLFDAEATVSASIESIITTLKNEGGWDFSGYKRGTLSRRVHKRAATVGVANIEDYQEYLASTPQESDLLAREVMVSVTRFFRDPAAIEALAAHIRQQLEELAPGEEVRAWITGCATGEEAYTLAMVFLDVLERLRAQNVVQIFATDIDDNALAVARQGRYSARSVEPIPRQYLKRFFTRHDDNSYEVSKSLRDVVLFARHNVISDPPFLRLHLVSCRNVLIYFDTSLQIRVLQRLGFALRDNGLLFLGKSESVNQADTTFRPLDAHERIFGKIEAHQSNNITTLHVTPEALQHPHTESPHLIASTALEQLGVVAMLCSSEGVILQTRGAVQHFADLTSNRVSPNLLESLHSPFRGHAAALLHKWQQNHHTHISAHIVFQGTAWRFSFSDFVRGQHGQLLVLIIPAAQMMPSTAKLPPLHLPIPDAPVDHKQLHQLIEELAIARQKAQVSNEELQANNEELEAAIEELKVNNEELINANASLTTERSALQSLNQEYAHLYDSFESPVMVFNRDLRLVRFNIAARQRYGLGQTHPANDTIAVLLPSYLSQLGDYLQQACQTSQKQRVAVSHQGRYYHIVITPALQPADTVEMLVVNVIDVTETQNTRDQLDESRSRLQTIMQHTTVMIAMKDLSGRYLYANTAFLKHFRLDAQTYIGKTDFQLLPEGFANEISSGDLMAIRNLTLFHSSATWQPNDQELQHFSSRHQVLRDHNGNPNMLIVEMENVTEQRQASDKLRIAAKVFQEAGEALVVTDPRANILSINSAFTRITGYTEDEAIGMHIGSLLSSGRQSQEFYANLWHTITLQGRWQGEIWNKRKNGDIFPEWLTITRVLNDVGDIDYFVAVFSDISNLKESQNQIEFLATHDTLTNLPNRALFLDRLENTLARSRRSKQRFAVMFLDLDNFKSINDTLGHDTGDQLLVEVANILVSKLRDEDTVARLGGDEFTILLNNCAPRYAEEVAQRIMESLVDPIHVDQRRIFTSVSIGLSLYPEDADDASGLLKAADTALYRSKESGRNHYSFFQNEMREILMRQSNLESALRDALRMRQFRLVYQPKVSAKDGTLNGAEALLRWYEPHLGDVSPAEFIPIAEKSSSIIDLSHLVIDMLAQQISRWQHQGLALPVISFNVSPRCLKLEHFAAEMIQIVSKYSVSPECIQVEITESSLMGDSQHPPNNLRLLKDAGFHISIDDFGTGYSSFSHLKKLPLDELKIDKSFVNQLGQNDDDESICQAILWVSKALRLNVVAEGVETDLQAQWLIQNGCDTLQGFLYSKPLEAADFKYYLTN